MILVKDANSNPVPGAKVGFTISSGGGTLSVTTATTDSLGRADTTLTLPNQPGATTVTATVGSLPPASFGAVASPGPPAKLTVLGTPRRMPAGAVITPSLQVRLYDSFGNATVGSVSVTLSLAAGPGSLTGTLTQGAASGTATFADIAVDTSGTHSIEATAPGLTPDLTSTFVTGAAIALDGLGHSNDATFDFTRSGNFDVANPSTMGFPWGLAVDSVHHRLFVSDFDNNRVLVFTLSAGNGLAGQPHFATYVLGQSDAQGTTATTSRSGLRQPAGLAYDWALDRLYVCDRGNNRVLVFDTSVVSTGMDASFVLGQASFTTSTGVVSQTGMRAPGGVALNSAANTLYVADQFSSRVLVFDVTALSDGMAASFVIGQANFTTANTATTQNGLNNPQSVAVDPANNRLFVGDSFNARVLIFPTPIVSNQPNAQFVLGQPNFGSNSQTRTASGLAASPGVAYDGTKYLHVADGNNNRVMVFDVTTPGNGLNASFVLGQPDFVSGTGASTQTGMIGPFGVAMGTGPTLFVADGANYRVLQFDTSALATGMAATEGVGHSDTGTMVFTRSKQNDSPNGAAFFTASFLGNTAAAGLALDITGHRLFVADSGGSRVLVFGLTSSNGFAGAARHAQVVLGQPDFASANQATTQGGMGYPTSVAFDPATNRIFVGDGANNRVLVFSGAALANGMNASFVLGQATFGMATAATTQSGLRFNGSAFYFPPVLTGVAVDSVNARLYVADRLNNRILVFNTTTLSNGMNASFVLGQATFTTSVAGTSATGMNQPAGVAVDPARNRLWVADTGNHRVLVFDTSTLSNGMSAAFVLGQSTFTTAASATTASGLNQPTSLAVDGPGDRLLVTDTGNNRVMVFATSSVANGMNAATQLGQDSFTVSVAGTSQSSLKSPHGVAFDPGNAHPLVLDRDGNRVLLFGPP
ncbi:MAG: Ig-like domain-containing protein [Planctomycetota bacterium]